MKNFDMQCPVSGTSALQPEFEHARAHIGTIIEFPSHYSCIRRTAYERSSFGMHAKPGYAEAMRNDRRGYLFNPEMTHSLRHGSISGVAYGRVKPWQAALVGCAFSAFAFASLLLGL
ncbi:MAG: hypothetical protein RSB04_08845 [Gordonibacter sp.]|uniref:hypothetical protein n=1 Tax=Gordonibacter sp. TaxID=1968902 RepID=UPI002FC75187